MINEKMKHARLLANSITSLKEKTEFKRMAMTDPKADCPIQKAVIGKKKCPDCLECQMCSKRRCELCKKGGHKGCNPELGSFITHGEYMKWKEGKSRCQRFR
jgi:hypothetical protein